MADMENKEKIEPTETQNENEAAVSDEENSNTNEENPVAIQAARYAYISNLESRILSDDESVSDNDLMDVNNCKSQVLVELVSVANYASELPADSPQKKAAEVLMKHLYKCYEKTERMQERTRAAREKTKYINDVKQVAFEDLPRQYYLQQRNIITDAQLMPNSNVIDLTGLGLSTGSVAMLSQLIKNPSESIKAQLPDLIDELGKRLTGEDKKVSDTYIGKLLTELSTHKTEKAMFDVLEGNNIAAHVMALAGGKSL